MQAPELPPEPFGPDWEPPIPSPQPEPEVRPPVSYFGTLAPSDRAIEWMNRTWTVRLRPLELGEEIEAMAYARRLSENNILSEEYVFCQGIGRLSYAILAVNGEDVAKLFPGLQDRRQWLSRFDPPLAMAIQTAYNQMLKEPVLYQQEMDDDPNSGATPSASGSS